MIVLENDIIQDGNNEDDELNAEFHQVAEDDAERHNQAGEINLSEDVCIIAKDRTGFGQTFREIIPGNNPCHVEQWRRQVVRAPSGNAPEYKNISDGSKKWLNKKPKRPEDGLFVKRNKITPNQQPQQITIVPGSIMRSHSLVAFSLSIYFR